MQSCRSVVWLLVVLAGLGSRLGLGEEIQFSQGVLHLDQISISLTGHWRPPSGAAPETSSVLPTRQIQFVTSQTLGSQQHADPLVVPSPDGSPRAAPSPALPPVPLQQPQVAPFKTPVPPQQGFPVTLTLDDLQQIALESNPTLAQARMAVRAAQGEYLQAGLYPNPTVGYLADEVGNDRTAGLQGAFLGQEVVTSGKLRLGRAVASYQVQQARYGSEAQRRRVLNGVRAGYYEVLLAQKMIELNQQLVHIGDEGVKVTEQLKEVGEVSDADVLQAHIEADTARLGLVEADHRHRGTWRRLTAVVGRPEMEPVALAGEVETQLPVLHWEETLTQLLTQSPELSQARAGVRRARCEVAFQRAQRVPNIQIGTAIKYDDGSHYTVADVELGLALPLFDRNQGNIVKAQADLITAQRDVERIELDLRDRLATAFEQYATARQHAESYASVIRPNAEKSLELTRSGYRLGQFGYLTLLTAQRTYFGVNLDYLTSLGELWARTVEIDGMLLSGGLEGPQ